MIGSKVLNKIAGIVSEALFSQSERRGLKNVAEGTQPLTLQLYVCFA